MEVNDIDMEMGDVVEVTEERYCNDVKLLGKRGIILKVKSYNDVCIEFDEFITGHSCEGRGKEGHCWWLPVSCLKVVQKKAASGRLAHKKICDELNDLYARKNHDYGNAFHDSFVEEGFAMARVRLTDKLLRFKTLSKTKARVTDESIRDTLIDLANYAIMTVMELDNMKGAVYESDT